MSEPAFPDRGRILCAYRAQLVAVEVETRRRREPPADKRQAFFLLFRGPKNPGLEQRIFALTNETLGSLELFLVPVGPDEVGMLYEAVFT